MAKKKSPKYADIHEWIAEQPPRRQAKLTRSLDELHDWYEHKEDGVLRWYEIGARISEFFPKDGGRDYGGNLIGLLADSLDPDRTLGRNAFRNQLWEFRKIANGLSRAKARAWAEKRNRKEEPLTLFHVSKLLSIEDRATRKEFLDRCLAQNWSISKVRSEVQNLSGGKRSRGRRKPKPKDVPRPAVALQDIQLKADQWLANHEVWFAGRKAALKRVPKREHTDHFYEELNQAAHALIAMQEAVGAGLAGLKKLAGEVEMSLGQ